jgi:hypothetical protein
MAIIWLFPLKDCPPCISAICKKKQGGLPMELLILPLFTFAAVLYATWGRIEKT